MANSYMIANIINTHGIVILDGGMATELERRGADLDGPLWSATVLLETPQLIEQVHYDYFAAGADVVASVSYQATFEGFADRGIDRRAARDLFRLSVQVARDARDRFWSIADHRTERPEPLVAASIGPYGAYLADGSEYRGDYGLSARKLIEFHRPRVEALADSGADLLAFETVPCAVEAEAIVRLLEEVPDVTAWISFSCRDEAHVSHGEPLVDCIGITNDAVSCVAAGINCTPPRFITPLLRSVERIARHPLAASPNSGEVWDGERHCWTASPDPIDFSEAAREWYEAGARLIGGCCRTTPETIKSLSAGFRC